MSGLLTAGALLVGGAAIKGVTGAIQNADANKIDAANIRPTQPVDPIYQENVNTAQQMANQGIPQAVINNQTNSINQNQASAIAALNRSSNPGSGLSSITRQGDNATATLNAAQAAARNKATLALIQQKGLLAGAKQKAFDYNYLDKYSEQLAKSQALKAAGIQNEAGATNALIGAGTAYLGNNTGKIGPDGQSRGEDLGANYANWDALSRSGGNNFTFQ